MSLPFDEVRYASLMSRLEASEVKLSECLKIIDFRIDANTYKKDYIKTDNLISSMPHKPVKDCITKIQNFGAYSLCNNIVFCDSGYHFLMTQNVRHNFIDWSDMRYVDNGSHALLHKSHCSKNQVLVTMAGEYLGRVAVYNKDFISSSNQAIAKLTISKGFEPYYISTFLNTKYGQNQINRLKTITGQPNINMGLISELKIVILSDEFQKIVKDIVLGSYDLTNNSNHHHQTAQNILLTELGLADYRPPQTSVSVKTFSESFGSIGRLDAEYYQPKYDEIESKISAFKKIKIKNLVNYPVSSGITPKAGGNDYTVKEFGIPFVRAVDIIKDRVEIENCNYIKNKIHSGILKRTQLKQDDVLFSIAGTVGRCGIFDCTIEANINQAVSILRFDEAVIKRLYLICYFNSCIGELYISKYARQGLQTNLNLDEVSNLEVPILDMELQKQISEKIQQSFNLRKKSVTLLERAKQAVEMAIEQGEAVAIKWLEEKENE